MATRKRSGSSTKRPKEKVVFIYETLFKGQDYGRSNEQFWNEFFLLLPNVDALENELLRLNQESLSKIHFSLLLFVHFSLLLFLCFLGTARKNINEIFTEAINILQTGMKEKFKRLDSLSSLSYPYLFFTDNPKRVLNALQTLSVLIIAVFKKASTSETGFDIINTLIGFEEADEKIKLLVNSCNNLLQSEYL